MEKDPGHVFSIELIWKGKTPTAKLLQQEGKIQLQNFAKLMGLPTQPLEGHMPIDKLMTLLQQVPNSASVTSLPYQQLLSNGRMWANTLEKYSEEWWEIFPVFYDGFAIALVRRATYGVAEIHKEGTALLQGPVSCWVVGSHRKGMAIINGFPAVFCISDLMKDNILMLKESMY